MCAYHDHDSQFGLSNHGHDAQLDLADPAHVAHHVRDADLVFIVPFL